MTYKNNVKYQGVFGGVAVTFQLQNFSEKIIDEFNSELIERAVQYVQENQNAGTAARI